jgi:hypothetical protein
MKTFMMDSLPLQTILNCWKYIRSTTETFLASKQVQDLIKLSEQAIKRSETSARGWFLQKLQIDTYLQENGWSILLKSLTPDNAKQLATLLSES